jgi:hypothetical protein
VIRKLDWASHWFRKLDPSQHPLEVCFLREEGNCAPDMNEAIREKARWLTSEASIEMLILTTSSRPGFSMGVVLATCECFVSGLRMLVN